MYLLLLLLLLRLGLWCPDHAPDPEDVPVEVPEHGGKARPRAATARLRDALGRFLPGTLRPRGLYPCAVPGISLTDFSPQPQPGWGSACAQARTTITLSNGVRITVASRIAKLVQLILNEELKLGYKIRQADTGAYNCRYIGGTTTWSVHAWALAIDVNWTTNPFSYTLRTDHPATLRRRFNRYGFCWGGDWSGKKDAMHYQFMGTPAQADAATALAIRELTGTAPAPTPTGLPKYAPGSRVLEWQDGKPVVSGTDVKTLQDVLNKWYPDLTPLTEDGFYGQRSAQRVLYLQGKAGLTQDGICGSRTWAVLGF